MKVRFIGTGQLGTKRRCTSFLVNESILFEIGNGTVAGLLDNRLDVGDISIIVISHFHGDHFGDIVHFLHRRSMQGLVDKSLMIIGPRGLAQKIIEFNNLLFGDIRDHKDIANIWNIKFAELDDGSKIILGELEIEAFKVDHSTLNANGYIIKSITKALGYTGDACMSNELIARIPEVKNWIIDANEMMRKENFHIGFSEVIGLADTFPRINFYAVHRKDYETGSNVQINLMVPMDDEEIFIK